MEYEIDFMPVGTGEKSGDAIAVRVWNTTSQWVFVIDGGTKDSGKALVQHIKTHYKTNKVDLVISTHPDGDHASGLSEVLENMEVGGLLMHKPWEYADQIKSLFENPITPLGLQRKIKEGLQFAHDLKVIADRKGIKIIEPYAGAEWTGIFQVLGPSENYYKSLLPNFRCTPDAAQPATTSGIFGKVQSAIEWVAEEMHIETLTDENEHFSAENNSSTILLFTLGADKILFAADADSVALSHAADFALSKGVTLADLTLLHVPHHGSKHNVGPTILNRIKTKKAQISASAASSKHPSKKVVNALIRRQSQVFTTAGNIVCHRSTNAPAREGWSAVPPLLFSNLVEK